MSAQRPTFAPIVTVALFCQSNVLFNIVLVSTSGGRSKGEKGASNQVKRRCSFGSDLPKSL